MARPIFTHELADADFSWLLTTFQENNPNYVPIELGGLPVMLLHLTNQELHRSMVPALPHLAEEETAASATQSDKVKES